MKRFLLPLLVALALPTAVSAGMDSLKYNKEADDNGQIPFPAFPSTYGARTFAAGVLTHSRCAATQGYMTGKEAVLNAQNTMYKNGYSIKILDEYRVMKAAEMLSDVCIELKVNTNNREEFTHFMTSFPALNSLKEEVRKLLR